ncbi:MMPL family transporter [Streptomyces sp. SBC-4]|nr:MMPL family transporter [Streptomyces sp. SBC-4]MDV5148849.1 MMPL family transporter [Streptomyces sp. SBC-4]
MTAAALILAVSFAVYATGQVVFLKQLGIGMALAVLVDATLIRGILVPALMSLAGPANWWAPAPLRRLHDRIGLTENATSGRRGARRGGDTLELDELETTPSTDDEPTATRH